MTDAEYKALSATLAWRKATLKRIEMIRQYRDPSVPETPDFWEEYNLVHRKECALYDKMCRRLDAVE